MVKKVAVVLLLALIALALGLRLYRVMSRGKQSGPSHTESPGLAPSAPGSSETATGPSSGKGSGIAPHEFTPRTGEVLDFSANVTKLNSTVANLQVKVGEPRNIAGKSAWHLQAFAHTENPYRMVFELDDQFDSYSELANLVSLQYEMHLNERGQKVDSIQRMMSSSKDPAPANAAAARVLPGTRDPIGMLMYLRSVDWEKTREVRSPVFDGHKLYDVRAELVAKGQNVTVPAGKFTTNKIELHVLDNGTEMKDAHFWLYIAQGGERLPVFMEAVLPFAAAHVELTKIR